MTRFLKEDVFGLIVESTPLISIDLIVRSSTNKVLLGKRLNRPAQNFWFVPGGRIHKNESLDEAFMRIALEELSLKIYRNDAKLLGVFEHFYQDSQYGLNLKDSSTHYVVLGYQLIVENKKLTELPQTQHIDYEWWDIKALIESKAVHQYVKNYMVNIYN
jgi:colanic acid biosynthesis protein WcaH